MPPNAIASIGGTIQNSNLSTNILSNLIRDNTLIPSGGDGIGDVTSEEFLKLTQENSTNISELNKYQYLNNTFITQLIPLLTLFKEGSFADLSMQFTTEIYRKLGVMLESQRDLSNIDTVDISYNFNTFNKYISAFHSTLDGFEKATTQSDTLVELREAKNQCDFILNDPQNLVSFFKQQYTGVGIDELNTIVTTNTSALLKLEYVIYIQRHGVPSGGIFDSEKMSVILFELNNTIIDNVN